MAAATYERVIADAVEVGDRIARTRTAEFQQVTARFDGPTAVRFTLLREDGRQGGSIRPRKTAKLWRVARPVTLDSPNVGEGGC
jgi:hypothetical protein